MGTDLCNSEAEGVMMFKEPSVDMYVYVGHGVNRWTEVVGTFRKQYLEKSGNVGSWLIRFHPPLKHNP